MEEIRVKRKGDTLLIGETPQLVVNLKSQDNYIDVQGKKIPYQCEIAFSEDLLHGKRQNVFRTAIKHHYRKACEVVEGIRIAEQYRSRANKEIREIY